MAEQDEAIQFPREPQQPPEALDQAQQEPEPPQVDQPPRREPQPQIPAEEPTDLEVTFVCKILYGAEFGRFCAYLCYFIIIVGGDAAFWFSPVTFIGFVYEALRLIFVFYHLLHVCMQGLRFVLIFSFPVGILYASFTPS